LSDLKDQVCIEVAGNARKHEQSLTVDEMGQAQAAALMARFVSFLKRQRFGAK
jgi:hypothetical protein